MKRARYIIGLLLMAIYMLSMVHATFHCHFHNKIAHASSKKEFNCSCSHHHHTSTPTLLDHTHPSDNEAECNIETQFVPTNSTIKSFIKSISLAYFTTPTSSELLIDLELTKEICYYLQKERLISPPEITQLPLRAPPIC